MTQEEILELIRKYNNGEASAEEQALLESWYLQPGTAPEPLSEARINADLDAIYRELPRPARMIPLWQKVTAAAVVSAVLFTGFYFLHQHNNQQDHAAVKADAAPGGNRATLTLANGTVIDLSAASQGRLTEEAGTAVSKTSEEQLVYASGNAASDNPAYNTVRTPRGGQYTIVLPDGSKAWLNAASELTFPVGFTSQNRQVSLKGEAYFEVMKDAARPFVVNTDRQEVKVLGTRFSINAYSDEPATKTTLQEGSVMVINKKDHKSLLLQPNDQAVLDEDLVKNKVDAAAAIAWTNGKFTFNEEPLADIMRKLARWYDLEIEFKDPETAAVRFGGTVSRFDNVSKVLRKLEATGDIQFSIIPTDKGNHKVIVIKK